MNHYLNLVIRQFVPIIHSSNVFCATNENSGKLNVVEKQKYNKRLTNHEKFTKMNN
jgi:hypothetical protein